MLQRVDLPLVSEDLEVSGVLEISLGGKEGRGRDAIVTGGSHVG